MIPCVGSFEGAGVHPFRFQNAQWLRIIAGLWRLSVIRVASRRRPTERKKIRRPVKDGAAPGFFCSKPPPNRTVCCSVPEVTRNAGIQLNARVSLCRHRERVVIYHRTIAPRPDSSVAKPLGDHVALGGFALTVSKPGSTFYEMEGLGGAAESGAQRISLCHVSHGSKRSHDGHCSFLSARPLAVTVPTPSGPPADR
jgi:hypothetical protein